MDSHASKHAPICVQASVLRPASRCLAGLESFWCSRSPPGGLALDRGHPGVSAMDEHPSVLCSRTSTGAAPRRHWIIAACVLGAVEGTVTWQTVPSRFFCCWMRPCSRQPIMSEQSHDDMGNDCHTRVMSKHPTPQIQTWTKVMSA